MKKCTKCGEVKDQSRFYKAKLGRDGLRASCKSCEVRRASDYVNRNREKVSARKAEHRKSNSEKIAKTRARWLSENSEGVLAYAKEYAQRNPEKRRAAQSIRRARKLSATPCWFGELDEFVMQEAAALCADRERATGLAWQVDHMIPLQAKLACGLHCAANLQVMPAELNRRKRNKMIFTKPFEWLKHG